MEVRVQGKDGPVVQSVDEVLRHAQRQVGDVNHRETLLAAYCYVIGGDHDWSDPSAAVLAQGRTSAGVAIGAGAWLGAGAKILDGVTIGPHAVIGAAAVVREDVPAAAIAVGIPARVVSSRGEHA